LHGLSPFDQNFLCITQHSEHLEGAHNSQEGPQLPTGGPSVQIQFPTSGFTLYPLVARGVARSNKVGWTCVHPSAPGGNAPACCDIGHIEITQTPFDFCGCWLRGVRRRCELPVRVNTSNLFNVSDYRTAPPPLYTVPCVDVPRRTCVVSSCFAAPNPV